jgi:hypothetical protein
MIIILLGLFVASFIAIFYYLGRNDQKMKSELEAYHVREKIEKISQDKILEASKHWDKRRNNVKSWLRGKTIKSPPTTKSMS